MSLDALKDRTNEFKSCVEKSVQQRLTQADAKRPLLPPGGSAAKPNRSEFARMAANIGKDIQGTTFKLEKLAQRESHLVSCAEQGRGVCSSVPVRDWELILVPLARSGEAEDSL